MKTILIKILIVFALCFLVYGNVVAEEKWIKVDGGKWDPSPKMISDLKTKIEFYVRSQAKTQKSELQNWQTYTFQYQGIEERGKKYIFINALCKDFSKDRDLSKEIIYVFDGGSCYFSLKYDPKSNDFFDLIINGEA